MIVSSYKQLISYSSFSSFIPYALNYAYDAILTKDGELIKVIKINGEIDSLKLSEIISSFLTSIEVVDVAVWLTTIRSSDRLLFKSDTIDSRKSKSYEINNKFYNFSGYKFFENELYISIVHHDHANLVDLKDNVDVFSNFNVKLYSSKLENIYKRLSKKVENLLSLLNNFSPELLSIKKVGDNYISEIETFFSRIIKSKKKPIFVSKSDISSSLVDKGSLEFLDNEIALNIDSKEEMFGAIFSIKNHGKLKQEITEDLLNNDFPIIVTEIIIPKVDLEKKYNEYIINLEKFAHFSYASQDKNLSGYLNLIQSKNRYFLKQTSFAIFGSRDDISLISYKLNQKFIRHGVQAYRENIGLEEVFWSQFPGNFNFVNRIYPVSKIQLSNFNYSNLRKDFWYNSLIFSDFSRARESFIVNQKNKNNGFIFAEKSLHRYISVFISLNLQRFENIKISVFDEEFKFTNISHHQNNGISLGVLTTIQREGISKILQDYLALININDNDSIIFIDSFIDEFVGRNNHPLNCNNLADFFIRNNLLDENLKNCLSSESDYNIKFFHTKDLKATEYFSLVFLNCIIATLDKFLNNNDHLLQIHNFDILLSDDLHLEKMKKILYLSKLYDIYLYLYCAQSIDLITIFGLENKNILLFILLSDDHRQLLNFNSFALSNDIKNYSDYLIKKKNNSVLINFDGRSFFTIFDVRKFCDENSLL